MTMLGIMGAAGGPPPNTHSVLITDGEPVVNGVQCEYLSEGTYQSLPGVSNISIVLVGEDWQMNDNDAVFGSNPRYTAPATNGVLPWGIAWTRVNAPGAYLNPTTTEVL